MIWENTWYDFNFPSSLFPGLTVACKSSLHRGAEPFFEQILLGYSRPFLSSAWLLHSPALCQVPRLSGSGSVVAQFFSHLQVSPGYPVSLVLPQLVTTVPAPEHCLCPFPTVSICPSDFKHPGLSWYKTGSPALGGEVAAKLQSPIWLSSKAPGAVSVPCAGPGGQSSRSHGAGPRDLPIGLCNLLTICF